MTTDDERDVRSMLQRQADAVTPSADAWEQIQARIAADERPAATLRRHPFRVMAGGAAAAAAVAAVVVAQVVPGSPTAQVASSTSTTVPAATEPVFVPPDFPYVFPDPTMSIPPTTDALKAAERYLYARTSVKPAEGEVGHEGDDTMVILFGEGPVLSEVHLRRSGRGWYVESAASDLVPLGDTAYDGRTVTGGVGIEMAGTLELAYRGGDGEPKVVDPPRDVARHELVELDGALAGEPYAVARAVLRGSDGTVAVSETWVPNLTTTGVGPDTGEGVDTYQGVWPAFTGEELAGYEDQAASGARPDLEDPRAVAGQFLGEVFFPRDTSEVSYAVEPFQEGDSLSGEVPFELSDGTRGVVAVRKASAEARTWFVVHATTDPTAFDVRTEGGGITVEPADGVTVTLAEAQPMPGGELVTGEPADHLLRFEDVTNAIVKLRGTGADGRTVISFSRVADAG